MDKKRKILITGCAGFIGAALSQRLIKNDYFVIGIDNLNNYYDVSLKKSRLKEIARSDKKDLFKFLESNINDLNSLLEIFELYKPDIVINLAAQAGVRYSIENPGSYIQSNLVGFSNVLEICRQFKIKNLIYASSSSVYGGNYKLPFKESSKTDHPISLYAATKKSNELLAHSYSHLYDIPTIGLRFFTVYGPWGRPDMAPMIFAKALQKKTTLKIFNEGNMRRDFTFIEDVVDAIVGCLNNPARYDKEFSDISQSYTKAPHLIFNVGNSMPIKLMDFIEKLENKFGIVAEKEYLPIQDGDVKETFADITKIRKWTGFESQTDIDLGLDKFVKWYKEYFRN